MSFKKANSVPTSTSRLVRLSEKTGGNDVAGFVEQRVAKNLKELSRGVTTLLEDCYLEQPTAVHFVSRMLRLSHRTNKHAYVSCPDRFLHNDQHTLRRVARKEKKRRRNTERVTGASSCITICVFNTTNKNFHFLSCPPNVQVAFRETRHSEWKTRKSFNAGSILKGLRTY